MTNEELFPNTEHEIMFTCQLQHARKVVAVAR